MKLSTLLIALTVVFTIACSGKKASSDHGHEHKTEEAHGHTHEDEGHHEQEEFIIEEDSTHTHDDGSEHHDH